MALSLLVSAVGSGTWEIWFATWSEKFGNLSNEPCFFVKYYMRPDSLNVSNKNFNFVSFQLQLAQIHSFGNKNCRAI